MGSIGGSAAIPLDCCGVEPDLLVGTPLAPSVIIWTNALLLNLHLL